MTSVKKNKRDNLVNLVDIHKDSMYTDFVLLVCDEADPHRNVLFQIDTHRLILYACSDYFARCFTFGHQQKNNNTVMTSMYLALNFIDGLTEEMVRLFFGLFYVRRFDTKHLGDLAETIESNIFFLYQLALRFHFSPLAEYCEALLFESWTLEYFGHLTRFCLIKNSVTGRYSIIDERLKLYARFLQWYQCCVEHIPYSPLMPSSEDAAVVPSSRYFSCQKEEILREHRENVDNFAVCHLPNKSHRNLTRSAMKLEYYRRICTSCLFNSKTRHSYEGFYLINFGAIRKNYTNGYEQYFFRLKRRIKPAAITTVTPLGENILELSLLRTYYNHTQEEEEEEVTKTNKHANRRLSATRIRLLIEGASNNDNSLEEEEEGMMVEEEKEEDEDPGTIIDNKAHLEQMPLLPSMSTTKYLCKTLVTLISKKVETDTISREYKTRDFALPTEINAFELHHEKWCYTGQCDTCRHTKPIYIMQMDISLEQEDHAPF